MTDWISVDDRLPPFGKAILTYDPTTGRHIHLVYWPPRKGIWETVTHWMPLPDPPEVDDGD